MKKSGITRAALVYTLDSGDSHHCLVGELRLDSCRPWFGTRPRSLGNTPTPSLCVSVSSEQINTNTSRATSALSLLLMMKRKSCASAFPRGSLLRPSVSSSWLCRSVRVPSEMGRHDTETLTERDSDAFVKFQPQACPPGPPRDTSRPTPRVCTALCVLRAAGHQPHTPSLRPDTSINKHWDSRVQLTVPARLESKCNIRSLLWFYSTGLL